MAVLEELEGAIQTAAERTGAAVIGLGQGWGRGSGFVFDSNRILTNAHNLRGDEVTVTFGDGRREAGEVLASDPDLDLAVIEVDTADIEPLAWAEDGRRVAADRPLGPRARQSRRPWPARHAGLRVLDRAQLPGPARAPDPRRDRAHGAAAARLLRRPADRRRRTAARRQRGPRRRRSDPGRSGGSRHARAGREAGRGEAPKRARLGVAIAPPRVARRLRRAVGLPERDGILVRGVERGSPADRAGLERGDLIVAAGGPRARPDRRRSTRRSTARRTGGQLELTILRGTDERTVTVSL